MPFDDIPIDQDFIPQDMLDVRGRGRVSRLPWKGQFTPEFVDVLLQAYAPSAGAVLDPFAGSGTVLFETVRRGLASYGAEVNDAAVVFSRVIELWPLSLVDRRQTLHRTRRLLSELPEPSTSQPTLWAKASVSIEQVIERAKSEMYLWRVVSAAIVLAQATRSRVSRETVLECLVRLEEIVFEPQTPTRSCIVHHADARALPIDDGSIDLVITSPPYINVHNYHQYARPAVELIGGSPLAAARSEIGANRKFRQNRFLTVVQYGIDMAQVLGELRRVITPNGRVVVIIGRESTVRGVPFENGRLLADMARMEGSFDIRRRLERSFINRFGERIIEDIIELAPNDGGKDEDAGREVGMDFLRQALRGPIDDSQRKDLEAALRQADMVSPSPLCAGPRKMAEVA